MPRASSNWLALRNTLGHDARPRKRRKIDRSQSGGSPPVKMADFPRDSSLTSTRHDFVDPNAHVDLESAEVKNGESIAALRKMVLGKMEYTTSQTVPGKYLALDCEMVGVGIEGNESSLARVSIVNYTGAVVLDVFVRQRERVVDYRTQWSGVRSTDLAESAKAFKEVQKAVADLIKDRILVGHAIYNDLKALLLSHPSSQIRDTQSLAYKHRVVKSRRPALRVLAKQELDIVIQSGEHSSVTDARATMALFRLYKKQWENGVKLSRSHSHTPSKNKSDRGGKKSIIPLPSPSSSHLPYRKRKYPEAHDLSDADAEKVDQLPESSWPSSSSPNSSGALHIQSQEQETSTAANACKPAGRSRPRVNSSQRKGVSSGISIVTWRAGGTKEIKRKGYRTGNDIDKTSKVGKWWESLGGAREGASQ